MPGATLIGQLRPGDHVYWTYDDDSRDRACADSIRAGVRAAGYTGLRAVGETAWLAHPAVNQERMLRYEAQANRVHTWPRSRR